MAGLMFWVIVIAAIAGSLIKQQKQENGSKAVKKWKGNGI